jgi:cytochrome c5
MHQPKLIALTVISLALVALAHSTSYAADKNSAAPAIVLESQKIELPEGNRKFEGEEPGARAASTYCVMCHSRGMIDAQPPLSREAWKTEIRKMRTAYGCPVSEGQDEELVDFLYQYNHKPTQSASGH